VATVLVRDDERAIRVLPEMVLTDDGHQVLLAIDGHQALERCKREGPHLVIADVMMPMLGGALLCRS
jgi:CheY-like chemotaxis protein